MIKRVIGILGLLALGAASPLGYHITTVATGLDHPWSLAFLPAGRVLVTERKGQLRMITADGKLLPQPIAGVPKVYNEGQGGLFDVVLHPQFAVNHVLYLTYAAGTDKANGTRVLRARLDGMALNTAREIFRVHPDKATPQHFGGRMAFLPDGSFVLTTGEGFAYREEAQKLGSQLGKTIRLNDDGSVPKDNPYVGKAGADPAVFTWGHRNPQGLAYDAATGRLYEEEHGPKGGDEINILRAGSNYGWPRACFGVNYDGTPVSPNKTVPGMVDGISVWVPSIAPSGLAVYRGAMFPEWAGDLFVGALAGEQVQRLHVNAAAKVTERVRVFPEIAERVRDVRVAPDGAIWVTTDADDGRVLRISR